MATYGLNSPLAAKYAGLATRIRLVMVLQMQMPLLAVYRYFNGNCYAR